MDSFKSVDQVKVSKMEQLNILLGEVVILEKRINCRINEAEHDYNLFFSKENVKKS